MAIRYRSPENQGTGPKGHRVILEFEFEEGKRKEWHKAGVKQLPWETSLVSTQGHRRAVIPSALKRQVGYPHTHTHPAFLQSLSPYAYRYIVGAAAPAT